MYKGEHGRWTTTAREEAEAAFIEPLRLDAFARGFFLGALYANGQALTTATIRKLCGVSRPTAKRDMVAIAKLARRASVELEHSPGRARVALRKKK